MVIVSLQHKVLFCSDVQHLAASICITKQTNKTYEYPLSPSTNVGQGTERLSGVSQPALPQLSTLSNQVSFLSSHSKNLSEIEGKPGEGALGPFVLPFSRTNPLHDPRGQGTRKQNAFTTNFVCFDIIPVLPSPTIHISFLTERAGASGL